MGERSETLKLDDADRLYRRFGHEQPKHRSHCISSVLLMLLLVATLLFQFTTEDTAVPVTATVDNVPVSATLKVVIMTDWHTNPSYNASLGCKCGCGRLKDRLDGCALQHRASRYGQFGCDSSVALTKASLRAASAALPDPDLVLVLGDYVTHSSPSTAFNREVFDQMSQAVHEAFPTRPAACQVRWCSMCHSANVSRTRR